MSRVVVLGGCGAVGSVAVETLAGQEMFTEVVIGDQAVEKAGQLAKGLGEIAFEDIPALIEYERSFEPDPGNRHVHDRRFKGFTGIYRNNRAMYRRLNGT